MSASSEAKDATTPKFARFTFPSLSAFEGKPDGYRLMPFRFMRFDPSKYILVNECGEYVFLDAPTFRALAEHRLAASDPHYGFLKSRNFLADDTSSPLLDILATKYRTKKSFLAGFTKLHIFVTTLRCDHSCLYCQVSRQSENRLRFDMMPETARRSIDLMFRSPAPNITMEFQGGEPLLNFDLIRFMVQYTKERNEEAGKRIDFVMCTNLSRATREILEYCREQGITISTSLDGPEFLHNLNRKNRSNESYQVLLKNITFARSIVGVENVAALMTTTRESLKYPKEIIDEYVRNGFKSIFLRPLNPYGFAVKNSGLIGYTVEEFVDFYRRALAHIVELNRKGTDFIEAYAKLILTKILTPFPTNFVDLQSPNGAAIGVVVYNYDGDAYASDESRMLAEMGDHTFRLGNVHRDSYDELFKGQIAQTLCEASVNESLPGCSDCPYQTYCGGDPLRNHVEQGDIIGHRPTSNFCKKNMGITNELFRYILSSDRDVMRIFWAWIHNRSVNEDPSCPVR